MLFALRPVTRTTAPRRANSRGACASGASALSPSARRRSSSFACDPCARHSARRARASSRIRDAPARRGARPLPRLREQRFEAQLLPGARPLRRPCGRASAASASALRCWRSTSRSARASRIALALGFALEHRRIVGIVFGPGEELLGHCLARLGGGGLAVLETVRVQKRHLLSRVECGRDARAYATERAKRQWLFPQRSIS